MCNKNIFSHRKQEELIHLLEEIESMRIEKEEDEKAQNLALIQRSKRLQLSQDIKEQIRFVLDNIYILT